SVFKILDNYPEDTKASLRKSREEYIRNIRMAEESVRSSQRMLYNSVLAQAYFKQFQFEEVISYSEAWLSEYSNMMKNSAETVAKSTDQIKLLPDSTRKMMEEVSNYLQVVEKIGGQATSLIISA